MIWLGAVILTRRPGWVRVVNSWSSLGAQRCEFSATFIDVGRLEPRHELFVSSQNSGRKKSSLGVCQNQGTAARAKTVDSGEVRAERLPPDFFVFSTPGSSLAPASAWRGADGSRRCLAALATFCTKIRAVTHVTARLLLPLRRRSSRCSSSIARCSWSIRS